MSKKKSTYVIKISALLQHKIFSMILSIFLITTVFSSLSFTAKSENNKLINNISSKFSEKISEIYTRFSKDNDNNKPGGFFKKIINFITNRSTDRKEIIPLHVVTNYNGHEKITKMKLFRPTSIDVDGDKDYDIRVWCFRTPAIDLRPPSIATKMSLVVRRLPGMNDIKNDLFEIYLEYYPRIITKFFYLTLNIDLVRIGYQSPAGGEVPKTFILTDKTVPHLLYPKLKTTHKISVNPGSATGKHPLNLILSFIDVENYTYYQDYAELKIMVNYNPAVKIKDITFNRNKDRLIGRGQTLEIIRNEEPSNVTLSYNREIDYLDENEKDESNSATFTVRNIPKHVEISWFIGKNGYLDINTNNEDMGYFKASINNVIFLGFDPLTETHIRIGWENRTLKNYLSNFFFYVFNLSIEVYNSIELKDFYFSLANLSKNFDDNNTIENLSLKTTASHLILNLNSSAKIGNYITQYFLFPIYPGLSSATSIDWHLENLQIIAYNLTFDVDYTQNDTHFDNNKFGNVDNLSNSHASIKYLEFSFKKSSLSIDLINFSLSASGEGNGNIDIKKFDFSGKNAKASFSYLTLYLSSSMDITVSNITTISVSGNGFLEIANLSYNKPGDSILQIDLIKLHGDFLLNIQKKVEDNAVPTINGTGDGYLEINNLYIYNKDEYYEYDNEFSFSYLNLSSCPPGVIYFDLIFDPSSNINGSINIDNGLLEIMDFCYRAHNVSSDIWILKVDSIELSRDFSLNIRAQTIDENPSSLMINSNGEGYLEINNLYIYNNNEYDEYESELNFSYFNISSYPSGIVFSALTFENSLISVNQSFIIDNGFLEIRDVYYRSYDQESNLIIRKIDLIKLYHNILYNILDQQSDEGYLFKESINGDGSLEIDNLYFYNKDEYGNYESEFSFSYLNVSSYPSSIIDSFLVVNSSSNENVSIFIDNGLLNWEDLYYRSNARVFNVDFINVSKNLFLNFESVDYYPTKISIGGDGDLEIKNINFEDGDIYLEIDFINKSGDSSFSFFSPFGENIQNILNINHLDGIITISGVRSSNPYVNALDYLYLDGNGDIEIERWNDADTFDYHIYLESQNGLMLKLFSIELDNGINYTIERQGTIEGYIGEGFLHLGVDLNGDGDGFIFLDSSDIEFEDLLFTYKSSILNRELRFTPNIESFDADSFLLQWDSFTLNNEDNTVIPYNWYKTGSISADFDIGIMDGDNYYQLWPLEDQDDENQELDATEYLYYEGTQQPLEYGPPKPQKPVGPHGGIIIGRIVEGNKYTFSTLNNDIYQLLSYKWDWDDGTDSEWSAYLPSGVGVTGTHTWDETGSYSIRVKVKNMNGEESSWSDPLTITVRLKLSDDEQSENQNEEIVGQNQNYNQGQPTNS